ncbi:uncharacterized protein LOC108739110 [Agrilus planipennis]|uniref:Uncharacterized protein LOC108739110 n=1 Tax=Agrilus planipennis TaxID=224129 RepID=A0A1W4X7M5_AGRPL|nr:uncharacterized protein LOC108739110 [Agrilus planipennis]XP_025828994.1 uncharacterized protein LOC108739110 [Agrilus planipennis]XP_025828995.1 uncharacterized protein LOC108739110 [Agrilus planipennis]
MMFTMEWTNDMCLELIAAYRERPMLWNSDHPCFKISSRKIAEWDEIAEQLKTDVESIKRKISSLLASYRRERRMQYEKRGYRSSWFAYESLDAFLHDRYKRKFMLTPENRSNSSQPPSEIETRAEPLLEADYEDDADLTGDYQNIKTEGLDLDLEVAHTVDDPRPLDDTLYDPLRRNPKRLLASTSSNKSLLKRRRPLVNDDLLLDVPLRYSGDECTAFGHYLACKLREYDPYTRALVQHRINNILFDTDVGKLNLDENNSVQFDDEASVSAATSPQTSKI